MAAKRSPYVWDYDISEDELKDMLVGKLVLHLAMSFWKIYLNSARVFFSN